MLEAMDHVGKALRDSFKWVPPTDYVYLVMDNAGGHGTDVAKDQYVQLLDTKFKVKVIWQVPRSSETNLHDLGVRMCTQAAVEKEHTLMRCNVDALAKSVMRAWGGPGLTKSAGESIRTPQSGSDVHY